MKIENPFRVIIFSVIIGHLLALLFLSFETETQPIPQRKKLRVSTVKLRPAPANPLPKSAPAKKKPAPAKKIVKKEKKPAKKTAKLTKKQKKLFEKAREKIAILKDKSPTKGEASPLPELKIENFSLENDDYTLVAEALQNTLCLPEIGKVKIAITIGRDGKVKDCKILGSESKINEKYVEKTVKTVQFFKSKQEKTYTITLVNET